MAKESFKLTFVVVVIFLLATISFAEAQQAKKVPRIGYLFIPPPSANEARIEAFRQGLREGVEVSKI